MFAVPGWSISAEALATQHKPIQTTDSSKTESGAGSAKTSRKRKRDQAQTKGPIITDENFASLWRKHIDGKDSGVLSKKVQTKRKERRRKQRRKDGEIITETKIGAGSNIIVEDQMEEGEVEPKISEPTDKEHPSSAVAQPNGENAAEEAPRINSKLDGKARYEQRKALALEKRKKKLDQQINGIIPPARPGPSKMSPAISPIPHHSSPPPPSAIAQGSPQKPPSSSGNISIDFQEPTPMPDTIHHANITEDPKPQTYPQLTPSTINGDTLALATLPLTSASPLTKLTPLQTSMRQKLISARFRHLNQTLYTTPSTHAATLFSQSPDAYTSYHTGFRAQVAIWPQNPIETFIADIKARAQAGARGGSFGSQKKSWRQQRRGKAPAPPTKPIEAPTKGSKTPDPLPRSARGICTIADLGCGDATLAATLAPLLTPLSLRIHSIDLARGTGPNAALITVADLCGDLPLGSGTVDVAIFCLALMGTNWVAGVDEAARILRPGGEVWVAEIRSRFVRPAEVPGSVKPQGNNSKGMRHPKRNDDVEADASLLLSDSGDADNAAEKNKGTDVRAFVAVFRKRGFALRADPDLDNRMFVLLRFVKEARGVGSSAGGAGGAGAGAGAGGEGRGKGRRGITDPEYEIEKVAEGKVLKPCVYKTR